MNKKNPKTLALELMVLQIALLGFYREIFASIPLNSLLKSLTLEKIEYIKSLSSSIEQLEKELEDISNG